MTTVNIPKEMWYFHLHLWSKLSQFGSLSRISQFNSDFLYNECVILTPVKLIVYSLMMHELKWSLEWLKVYFWFIIPTWERNTLYPCCCVVDLETSKTWKLVVVKTNQYIKTMIQLSLSMLHDTFFTFAHIQTTHIIVLTVLTKLILQQYS